MIWEVIRFTAYRDKCGPNIGLSVAHVIMSTVPSGAQTEIVVLYDAHVVHQRFTLSCSFMLNGRFAHFPVITANLQCCWLYNGHIWWKHRQNIDNTNVMMVLIQLKGLLIFYFSGLVCTPAGLSDELKYLFIEEFVQLFSSKKYIVHIFVSSLFYLFFCWRLLRHQNTKRHSIYVKTHLAISLFIIMIHRMC